MGLSVQFVLEARRASPGAGRLGKPGAAMVCGGRAAGVRRPGQAVMSRCRSSAAPADRTAAVYAARMRMAALWPSS